MEYALANLDTGGRVKTMTCSSVGKDIRRIDEVLVDNDQRLNHLEKLHQHWSGRLSHIDEKGKPLDPLKERITRLDTRANIHSDILDIDGRMINELLKRITALEKHEKISVNMDASLQRQINSLEDEIDGLDKRTDKADRSLDDIAGTCPECSSDMRWVNNVATCGHCGAAYGVVGNLADTRRNPQTHFCPFCARKLPEEEF